MDPVRCRMRNVGNQTTSPWISTLLPLEMYSGFLHSLAFHVEILSVVRGSKKDSPAPHQSFPYFAGAGLGKIVILPFRTRVREL